MTIDEIINSLEDQAQDKDRSAGGDTDSIFTADAAALIEAANILRRQNTTPPNDPLSLEELRGLYGEPVWLVRKKPSESNWDIFNGFCDKIACFVIASARIIDDYGKTWLAYRHKPEEVRHDG